MRSILELVDQRQYAQTVLGSKVDLEVLRVAFVQVSHKVNSFPECALHF